MTNDNQSPTAAGREQPNVDQQPTENSVSGQGAAQQAAPDQTAQFAPDQTAQFAPDQTAQFAPDQTAQFATDQTAQFAAPSASNAGPDQQLPSQPAPYGYVAPVAQGDPNAASLNNSASLNDTAQPVASPPTTQGSPTWWNKKRIAWAVGISAVALAGTATASSLITQAVVDDGGRPSMNQFSGPGQGGFGGDNQGGPPGMGFGSGSNRGDGSTDSGSGSGSDSESNAPAQPPAAPNDSDSSGSTDS